MPTRHAKIRRSEVFGAASHSSGPVHGCSREVLPRSDARFPMSDKNAERVCKDITYPRDAEHADFRVHPRLCYSCPRDAGRCWLVKPAGNSGGFANSVFTLNWSRLARNPPAIASSRRRFQRGETLRLTAGSRLFRSQLSEKETPSCAASRGVRGGPRVKDLGARRGRPARPCRSRYRRVAGGV